MTAAGDGGEDDAVAAAAAGAEFPRPAGGAAGGGAAAAAARAPLARGVPRGGGEGVRGGELEGPQDVAAELAAARPAAAQEPDAEGGAAGSRSRARPVRRRR